MNRVYSREYPSIYRGVVEDNVDPENLGRCKVRIPSIHGPLDYSPSLLPWARQIATSTINKVRGNSNVPDIGDIVWVMFEGADRNFPIYFGGTYGTGDISAVPGKIVIYTDNGNSISYEGGSWTINSGGNKLILSPEGATVVGNLTVEGSVVSRGNLTVEGSVSTTGNLSIGGSCNRECNCNH